MEINRTQSLRIFLQLLRRDCYVYGKRIVTYAINFSIIYPLSYAFCFAYLAPNAYFANASATKGTVLYAGNIMLIMLNIAYAMLKPIVFDLENDRFLDYQMGFLHPRWVLTEHFLFTSLFSMILLFPFYPISKLVLGNYLDTTSTNWMLLLVMVLMGILTCTSYVLCAMSFIPGSQHIKSFWIRITIPLFFLGGFWIPWAVIKSYSPFLGYALLLNPFMYITEGIKQALISGPEFLPLSICIPTLIVFTTVFYCGALYFFKKKVDHI